MKKDKYIYTAKDKEGDMLLIKEFSNAFEEHFKSILNLSVYSSGESEGIENYQRCIPFDLYGAQTIYIIPDEDNTMIWISTEIYPNGIIERTFTIDYTKIVKEESVGKFYNYS